MQKKIISCFLCAKILGVCRVHFLVLCGDPFSMCHAHSCCKGCGCICTWIDRTHVGSMMSMRYFLSSGMMHARYPYRSLSAKWVDLSMAKAPPSSFSRVLIDSGVIIPMIFVMASFWAMSISYAPFLDNFDDILASLLMGM